MSIIEKNGKISVVIPVYKVEQYLPQCVDSILNQTYSNWEMILVDDGSPDSSGQICDRYAADDDRIKVIHQTNQGPSIARNNGIEHSTGEFLMFVDSDDYIEKEMMEKMQHAAVTNDADLVISGYVRFSSSGRDERAFNDKPLTVFTSQKQLASFYTKPNTNMFGISIWAKLYRNEIIQRENIRFKPEISYEEDCQFNVDYFEKINRTAIINDIFYNYRMMEVSLSKGYRKNTFPFLVAGYNRRVDFVKHYSPATSLNGVHSIMLIVVKNTALKIHHSDMGIFEKIREYQKILDFEETQFVAKALGKSKNDLTAVFQKIIPFKSGLLLYLTLISWGFYDKIRKLVNSWRH